ncbi:hypothetical protein [Piscirickettsia salmonis]|uniref:hypothetical protein n=1 Tax=Piscirickettsia salmonis TaxID=1238 RepID=UPI003A80A242
MRITARRTGHQIDFHFPDNAMTDIFLRHFPIEHGPQGRMPIRNANVLSFPCYTARSGDFVINFGSQHRRDHFIYTLREATNLRHYDALNWLLTSPPHGYEGEVYLPRHFFDRENVDVLISNNEPHFTHQSAFMSQQRTLTPAPHRNPIPPVHHGAFATFTPPVNYGTPTAFAPQRMPQPSTQYRTQRRANTYRSQRQTTHSAPRYHRPHTTHRPQPQPQATHPTADHHRTVMPPPTHQAPARRTHRVRVARAAIATNQHTPTTRPQLIQPHHQARTAPAFPDMTPVTFTAPAIAPADAIPARNVFILPHRAPIAAHEESARFAAYNHLMRVLSTLNSDSRIMEFIQRAMGYPDKAIARATVDYCINQLAHPNPVIRGAIIAQMTIATGDCSTPIYDRLLELYIKMKIDKDEPIPEDIFARAMLARAIERETEALGIAGSKEEATEIKNALLMSTCSASAVEAVAATSTAVRGNPLKIKAPYDLIATTANPEYALWLISKEPHICAAFKAWICDADGNFSPEKLDLKVEEERRLLIGELPFANGTYDELMTYCQEKNFLDIT